MSSLFSGPKLPPAPEAPKPVRMPDETDPSLVAAGKRTRDSALRRKGRLSTILTDSLQGTSGVPMGGSSGDSLGY